ncbi:MAG: hypothetical protein LLG97_19605 [Deltaproteobacteria bacterium]|nr:hypothetical protein [Deltaproteobacteria bacterium]
MSEAISRFLNAEVESRVAQRLSQERGTVQPVKPSVGIRAASYGGSLGSPDVEEGTIWRRLTTAPGRNLIPIEQDRMIEIAYWLWQTNPVAGWLIDITTAFILAEGMPYEANNEDTKKCLEGMWNDPINRMPLYFSKHVNELHIFGELCLPAFTAKQTGRVRYGYIDPAQIKDVITDPENVKIPIGVLTRGWIGEIAGYSVNTEAKQYRTILPEEAEYVLSPAAKMLRSHFNSGECHFWSINNTTNSPRGRSSLLSVADWLDAYEQYLFDFAEKWPLMNAFVWDLLIQGAEPEEIQKQVKLFNKKSGSVYGHNEKITLQAMAPEMKAVDAEKGARLFRNHILGRFGYPEHWYGGGGDMNRATAAEMDLPALKMLAQKQLAVQYVKEDMGNYQIRQARKARFLRVSDDDARFTVTTPTMTTKDVAKQGAYYQAIASSLMIAENQGWLDKDTSRMLFAAITEQVGGVRIDLDQVKKAIEEEAEKKGYEDYRNRRKPVPGELGRGMGKEPNPSGGEEAEI